MTSMETQNEKTVDWTLVTMTAAIITLYMASNLMSVRIVDFGWINFDGGTITFPFVFMLENVFTEIWGFRLSRRVIFLTFLCNVLLMSATSLVAVLPAPQFQRDFTVGAYSHVFLSVPRLIVASMSAFLIGGLCNAWAMAKIRQMTAGRHLWMRTIGSSILGYLLDSVLFSAIAFAYTTPVKVLISIILVQFTLKIGMEIFLSTPIAYGLVAILRKWRCESSCGSL